MENLCNVMQSIIKWAHDKRVHDEQKLRQCKHFMDKILNRPGKRFLDQNTKDEVFSCEDSHRKLLGEKEVAWCLKSLALMLTYGDENTKKFKILQKAGNYPIPFGNLMMIMVIQFLLLMIWLVWRFDSLETFSLL